MTGPVKRIDQTRRRPQFSLRSATIAIVIVGIAASLWVSYHQFHENQRLRQENTQLLNDAGKLSIGQGQENLLHAVVVPVLEPKTWKWRLQVPTDQLRYLHAVAGQIPRTGMAVGDTLSIPLEPGEVLVELGVRRDHNGLLQWMIQVNGDFQQLPVSPSIAAMTESNSGTFCYTGEGAGVQRVVNQQNDLELLRCRAYLSAPPPHVPLLDPADGILVWISNEKLKQ
jgi:hypothetical protein